MESAHRPLNWVIAVVPIFFSMFGTPTGAFGQSEFMDEFQAGKLDTSQWCPCQIKLKDSPLRFSQDPNDPDDQIISITADEASLGGNNCHPDTECIPPKDSPDYIMLLSKLGGDLSKLQEYFDDETQESLGPSFIGSYQHLLLQDGAPTPRKNCPEPPARESEEYPYCDAQVMKRVAAAEEAPYCIQRQELRPTTAAQLDMTKPYFYSIRFRMPKEIEDECHSVRWVITQWKQELPNNDQCKKEFGGDWSPFLAQRFDNGVFVISVESEDCRCDVAAAPFNDGSTLPWHDGNAEYCLSGSGDRCKADLQVEYGDGTLTSPRGQWVGMKYLVKADYSGKGLIEIYEGNRFIVRVTGSIGHKTASHCPSWVKFKFGQYRNYMPFVHTMDVDWVSATPTPE